MKSGSKKSIFILIVAAFVVIVVTGSLFYWVKGHKVSGVINPCVRNLHMLDSAKYQWMSINKKATTDTPSWNDLKEQLEVYSSAFYRMTNGQPVCPQGGTYTLGRMDEPATCSCPIGVSIQSLAKQKRGHP